MRRVLGAIACLAIFVWTDRCVAQVESELVLDPRLTPMKGSLTGSIVVLNDGRLMRVLGTATQVSTDDGKSWQSRPITGEMAKLKVNSCQLVRVGERGLVAVFRDNSDRRWQWNDETRAADGKVWLHIYSARSDDEGATWTDVQKVQDGYCGSIRPFILTKSGALVLPLQRFLPEHNRHGTAIYVSTDGARSWRETMLFDLDGRGHHDGAFEPAIVQLGDGRLWLLLRTNHDAFYQSFSADDGVTWTPLSKSTIDSSSAPAAVRRLASGRLVMTWNRLGKSDGTPPRRRPIPNYSIREASWFREELSMAISDDDGKTWSPPMVIASLRRKAIAYPALFERRPGEIWLTAPYGKLQARFDERAFPAVSATPLPSP